MIKFYKNVGFGGLVGGGGMSLGEWVKRGFRRGMGLINDAFWFNHEGFFHGSESYLAL